MPYSAGRMPASKIAYSARNLGSIFSRLRESGFLDPPPREGTRAHKTAGNRAYSKFCRAEFIQAYSLNNLPLPVLLFLVQLHPPVPDIDILIYCLVTKASLSQAMASTSAKHKCCWKCF